MRKSHQIKNFSIIFEESEKQSCFKEKHLTDRNNVRKRFQFLIQKPRTVPY